MFTADIFSQCNFDTGSDQSHVTSGQQCLLSLLLGQAQASALNQHKPSPIATPMVRPSSIATNQQVSTAATTMITSGVPRGLLPVRAHLTSSQATPRISMTGAIVQQTQAKGAMMIGGQTPAGAQHDIQK